MNNMLRTLQSAARLTQTGQAFRIYQPYVFIHLSDSPRRNTYLPLNREHKPIGLSKVFVNYDDYLPVAVVFAGDPRKIVGVWHDPSRLTMYDDNPASRVDYFVRLARLHEFTMPTFGSFPPTVSEQNEMRRRFYAAERDQS